ncbi:MAG: hypothetical protein R6X08_12475 [Desulfosalsimonadaceae bacterium]
MARIEKQIEGLSKGGRVVILNGIYQQKTGRVMLRAEAPGGYADQFILEPLAGSIRAMRFKPAGRRLPRGITW